MDKAPPREANHRVAGSTPAMRRFRDVAYVPSSNEPAALRGGGLFFGRELREPRFRLAWRADPGRPGPLERLCRSSGCLQRKIYWLRAGVYGGTSQRGACRGASFPSHTGVRRNSNEQTTQPLRVKIVASTQPRSCCRFRVPLDSRENWSAYALLAEGGLLRAVSYQGQREDKPARQVVRPIPNPL